MRAALRDCKYEVPDIFHTRIPAFVLRVSGRTPIVKRITDDGIKDCDALGARIFDDIYDTFTARQRAKAV